MRRKCRVARNIAATAFRRHAFIGSMPPIVSASPGSGSLDVEVVQRELRAADERLDAALGVLRQLVYVLHGFGWCGRGLAAVSC